MTALGLKINTNISAMIAMRQLSATDAMLESSVTRLSTGLRINNASDDPAGLIISEGLRSQIKGIDQANRNVQDAVNMSKTAESALQEVSRLLTDLRALAVHSSNSATVDANQLQANQLQVRNIISSIDRIAEQTSWGTKKLLNGASGIQTSVTQTGLVSSMYLGPEFNGYPVQTGSITATRTTAATQTTTGALATTFASGAAAANAGTFVINGRSFTVQAGMTINDVIGLVNQSSGETGVSAALVPSGGNFAVSLTSVKYGSNFPINFLETQNILNNGSASNPASGVDAVFTVDVPTSNGTQSETFTGGIGTGTDGLTLFSPSGNRMVITPSGNATAGATVIGQVAVGSMRFQIGANDDQSALFSIPSIFAASLGTSAVPGQSLATVDVTSLQGALDAMKIADDAVNQIATLRGNLGSFQKNFLESTLRSLEVAQENLSASESHVRDADFAREMADYTRYQVLQQSGLSVLAHANKDPEAVLRLLQG